jgi:hypothetical protein
MEEFMKARERLSNHFVPKIKNIVQKKNLIEEGDKTYIKNRL